MSSVEGVGGQGSAGSVGSASRSASSSSCSVFTCGKVSSGTSDSGQALTETAGRTGSCTVGDEAGVASVAEAGGARTSPEYHGALLCFFPHVTTPAIGIVILFVRAVRASHAVSQVNSADVTPTP